MDEETCRYTFDRVFPNEGEVRPSMMISFTQHTPLVCLQPDDLEALNAMYPDCTHAITQEAVCFKTQHNIGWVRLGVYTLIPCIVALLLAIVLHGITQRYHTQRLKSARNLLRDKSRRLTQVPRIGDHAPLMDTRACARCSRRRIVHACDPHR